MKRILCLFLTIIMVFACCSALAATKGEENALRKAQSYLNLLPMSYNRLMEQLQYDGFLDSECKYAVDNCGADWYDQAAQKAENYLSLLSLSKSRLISQLEYDGFTPEQAQYGAAVAYGERPSKPGGTPAVSSQKADKSTPTEAPEDSANESSAKETVTINKNFDVSSLSYDELKALEASIIKELVTRPEYKEVLVPAGAYKVGTDIPAGKWTITASEGACEVYWGKKLDEYGVSVPYGERIGTLDDWGSKSHVDWELIEGTYIVINRNSVTFTPYVPKSLGF